MSKLQLILLGHFECLLSSGQRISLSMRKAEVLLAYLALAPGIRHPRERLINLLWSDRSEEQARNSLRQCLSAIKKSLGDSADLILQIDRATVSLKPGLIDVDALEFEQLAMQGDFESLSTAAGLYRGEFLEGISIRDSASQDWLDGERARFKRQFVEILANLGETQLISHDFSAAIKSTERLVEQDPLGESGWRLLMRSYADSGDRSHALQAYKRCQKSIRDELDVDPEAATLELRDQIAGGVGRPAPVLADKPVLRIDTPAATGSGNAEASADLATTSDHSIAVLPFDNLSGDPEQEYFSDGITDSIILNLSMFPGLQIKSRNSSFAFKQQIKSLGEISQELNVDYLVEGSIRKSHNRIRITVQLIETANGNQVWGKRYDAEIGNLFDLEEELSRTIAATVTGQIESDLQRIAIAMGAKHQQSYDLLLSGIYHARKFTPTDTVVAINKLNQCLEQDPENLRAHAQLCICHMMNWMERWIEDYGPSFELAAEHAHKALSLDPNVGYVQIAYAEYLIFNRELSKAAICIDNALQINPNDVDALAMKALILELQGDYEAALKIAELGYQLDPQHPWIEWDIAEIQYLCGRYEQALETISKSRNAPGFIRSYIVAANIKLGRKEQARNTLVTFLQECRETMLAMPQTLDEWLRYSMDNAPYADPNVNHDLINCLVQAGLKDNLTPESPAQSDENDIAVLPFDNLSGDPAQEYFSDGITESIILNLSLFPGLNVKSRNSSFAFKQQIKSIGEISEELEVDYIVEGSIRKTDERVRVTVQLVEAQSGNQVWGKRYDAEIENLFDLEEELSRSIAATVTGQIESDLLRIAITRGAADPQAYDLLLNGKYHLSRGNRDNIAIAIDEFNQCLSMDPDNAVAHANLFYCHDLNVMDHWTEDVAQSRELATRHIHKAVSLEPDLGLIQVAYANYLIYSHQFDKAEYQLKCAMDTNPNDPEAIAMLAVNLSIQGKAESALKQAELALKLDPYHVWVRWIKAESQYFCGRYEDCLATIADTSGAPAFIRIYTVAANIKLGILDNAKKALDHFLRFSRENMLSMPDSVQGWLEYYRDNAPFVDPAINQEIVDYLVQAGLEDELNSQQEQNDAGQQPSILVLPFNNMSGDPEQEYFSDGITESIILNLGTVNGLMVKSIHASFAFKDSARSFDEIAVELGVQYIVEGSIRKFGDKVRITAQLADTESGNQVWGKRFDYDLEDLFALEEELSLIIAGTVSGRIDKEAQQLAMRKPAKDMKSYDYFLRAIHHLSQFNAKDIKTGIELFEKCLALDTDNAEAHAGLGSGYLVQLFENCAEDRTRTRELMQQHLERALELDPDNAGIHAFMAEALLYLKDFERGGAHARKAVELNPTLPDGYAMMAQYSVANRQYDQAIQNTDQSIQIDPFHPYIGWNAGEIYRATENYERAIETFRALPHLPVSVHAQIAACLVGLGRIEEAREEMRHYLELAREQMISIPADKTEWYCFWDETMPYRHKEDTDRYFDLLLQAGLCDYLPEMTNEMPSVLVLPFENMSGDPEQEYFSDGISESIIVNLSSFNGLNVKSRHTSFAFKNSEKGIDEIAAELEIQYIVEGSIRKFGDKVRISVQLGETDSGNQLWGKRFESELEDLLSIEEELVQTIAGSISGRIGKDLKSASMHKPAKDLKSYDHLMRGIYHLEKFSPKDNLIAQQEFQQCIEGDPDNADAHSYLAGSLIADIYDNWTADREETKRQTKLHAERALELEPDNALAHAFIAEMLMMSREFERAEVHADRAIELNPTLPDGYSIKCYVMGSTRRYAEAIENAEISLKIDPHHLYMAWNAGEVFRVCGQYDRAIKVFRSMSNSPPSLYAQTAAALAALGKIDEAKSEMNRYLDAARSYMPNFPKSEKEWRALWHEHMPYQYDEDADTLFELLLKAGLCDYLEQSNDKMPRIAVLPFENMSGDPEQDYFSDGITTSIILGLGLFKGLSVKSRQSSFAFRDSEKPSEEIARDLLVDYLVEGSIRKSEQRVRVTVQLVDAESGSQIWGKQYDEQLDDIFQLEQELSQTIAGTISGRIGDTLQQSAVRKSAKDLKSYDYLLRGLYHLGRLNAGDLKIARQQFEQCLDIDPDNATAHTSLGTLHNVDIMENWSSDFEESSRLASHHLQTAIELEPDNALAHAYMAEHQFYNNDYERSEFHVDKAIELNPTLSDAYAVKADLLGFTRRIDEAVEYADKCIQLDPHSVGAGWVAGAVYRKAGLYQKAIKTFRSIAHPPGSVHALISVCFSNMELFEESEKEMQRYLELAKQEMPVFPRSEEEWRGLWRKNLPYQYNEDFDEFFDLLVQAGLLEMAADTANEVPSIAVLPFENMSGDPEQEHFSDGITTDIIATLSRFEHMRTVSRHSVLQYKNQHASIPDISQQQNVRYILEGSVRKSGNSIRVSAELIDSQDEKICWSEHYDRDLDDLFAVQDEITKNIALAMKVQLDDGEMALHRSKGATSIKAWELTLAAVDLAETYIRQNIIDARALTREAIQIDPDYAYAWINLGWTYWQEAYCGWSDSIEELIEEAVKANQHAMNLDPDYGEAWTQAGLNHQMKHEPEKAIAACLRAVELEAGSAEVHALTAYAYLANDDIEEARKHEQNMRNLCPIRPNWYYLVSGGIEKKCGHLDLAIELFQQGLDVEPDSPLCRFYLIDALMEKGDEARAQRLAEEIRALDKSMTGKGMVHANSYDAQERQRFHDNLAKFNLV